MQFHFKKTHWAVCLIRCSNHFGHCAWLYDNKDWPYAAGAGGDWGGTGAGDVTKAPYTLLTPLPCNTRPWRYQLYYR